MARLSDDSPHFPAQLFMRSLKEICASLRAFVKKGN